MNEPAGTEAQNAPAPVRSDAPIPTQGRWRFYAVIAAAALVPFIFCVAFLMSKYEAMLASMAMSPEMAAAHATLRFTFFTASGVLFVALVVGVYFAERSFVSPVRTLLAWLRAARTTNFATMPPSPVTSADEYGQLGQEVLAAVHYLHEVEERERQISHEKSEFLSVAAHQLRTPLTGLRWGLETIDNDATSAADRKVVVQQISATIIQMTRLMDDFLNVTKIEEGKFGYDFKMIDLVPLIEGVIANSQMLAQSRSVTLSFASHESPLMAYADESRISLAIANLVSNAIQYTEKGTVTISVRQKGELLAVAVADTGMGMTPEEQKQLFMKFVRSEDARRIRPDGSGLGLFIVKNIIDRHQGTIDVASEKGKGTTFTFTLLTRKPDVLNPVVTIDSFFGEAGPASAQEAGSGPY